MVHLVTNRKCPERIAKVMLSYYDSLPSEESKRRFNYFMLYIKGTGHRWTWSKWRDAKEQFENLNTSGYTNRYKNG